MRRFFYQIAKESQDYREDAMRVEAKHKELMYQFRDLQANAQTSIINADRPKSPYSVRRSLTVGDIPRIKMSTSNRTPREPLGSRFGIASSTSQGCFPMKTANRPLCKSQRIIQVDRHVPKSPVIPSPRTVNHEDNKHIRFTVP